MNSIAAVLLDITKKIESDIHYHWNSEKIEVNVHEIYYTVEHDMELLSKLGSTYGDDLDTVILENGTISIEIMTKNEYGYSVYIHMS